MTLARICTLPGLNWGRGRLRERWGTRLPHPPRHAESDGKRLSRVPQRRLSTQPNTRWSPAQTHEVRRLPPRFIRGGSPLPGPRPARPPPLSVLKQKEDWRAGGSGTWRFYTFWGLRLPPLPLPPQIFSSSSPASSALPCGAGRRAGEGGRCLLRTPQGWLPLPRGSSKRRSRAASPPPSGAARPPLAPRSPARPSQRKAAGGPRL